MSKKFTESSKPGPKADRVKSNRNWIDAIRDALKKERPKDGWPEPEKDKKKGRGS